MRRALLALPLLVSAACLAPTSTGQDPTPTNAVTPGLQYNGAIAQSTVAGMLEVSAPILPNSMVWQYKGGKGYPATQDDRLALIRDSTYSYEFLLGACATKYTITTTAPGKKLTKDQLQANYDQVSRCAYDQYGAKPYWVPQILNDVDVCGVKLGADWRLLGEDDLAGFSETDYQAFKDMMAIGQGADWFPRQFYFSLDVYVRGHDGALQYGNMEPGAAHISPLPGSLTDLYVGNGHPIGVRCIRKSAQ